MLAPRACACSKLSRTKIPEPSPNTKPERSLSKGIEARLGSVSVVKAVKLAKPATPNSQIAASVPPANITSA